METVSATVKRSSMKRRERLYIVDYFDSAALNFSAPLSDTLPDEKADAGRGIEEGRIYFLALLICRNFGLTEKEGMTASLFPRNISGERSEKNRAYIRHRKVVKFQK